MTVRPAVPADIGWMLDQLRAMAATFPSQRSLFPSDPAKADAILRAFVASQPFFVAVGDDGVPAGFLLGVLTPSQFNPGLTVLATQLLWVAPSRRGARSAHALIAHFEAFGRAHADWIAVTVQPDSNLKERSLARRGYRACDRSYLLEVA